MRKVRPNTRTTFRFVSSDDEAIGLEEGKGLEDGYQKYLETMDEGHLALRTDISPTFYWLRPMPLDIFRRAQDGLSHDEGETDEERGARLQSTEMVLVIHDALDRCLVGCDNHAYVTAIQPDGTFVHDVVSWHVGDKRPEGVLETILEDRALAYNMFVALLRAANLTDPEKKP